MSDDDSPDNVRHLPRIGAGPPPPVPQAPALDGDADGPGDEAGPVRISAFDAPHVPHAPQSADSLPAALRSDGLDSPQEYPDAGPPRTGALSLAAILAIALAAFEGLQTWIRESGPRRAEAFAHQRELELLAAKADADATRYRAEADREHARSRRIPSSHEYGRSALGRGSGSTGRGGSGIGAGRSTAGRIGPFNGSAQRSPGAGSRMTTGIGSSGTGRMRSGPSAGGAASGRSGGGASRNGGSAGRNDALWRRNGGSFGRSDAAGRRNGVVGDRNGGSGTFRCSTGGRGDGGTAGGRRTARQTIADWWGKGKDSSGGGSGSTPGAKNSHSAGRKAAVREAARRTRPGPTFWDAAGDRAQDRWKRRPGQGTQGTGAGGARAGASRRGNDGWTAPGDRVGFRDAVFDAMADRWKKRRERWAANGGPRPSRPGTPGSSNARSRRRGPSESARPSGHPGQSAGTGATGPDTDAKPGFGQPRSSPFDADTGEGVTITVEQVDPPGAHAKRWEPDAAGPGWPVLPRQGTPQLPRAPQRPAGPRPGTTRRKEPIAMPPAPARTASAAGPVTASVPARGGMSAQHATDITLDDALKALTLLTTAGMETHDECAELAKQARRLLGELETMAQDLAVTHNVTGPRTLRAAATLIETVAELVVQSERMARAALDAAEAAEAEETAMARDYRPTQAATADAGLITPSARIHNEN
ncbi:hypothetical protein [Streptomyces griseosporeus]|uniref:hypothetical protein n=1 Tax=Streptomyces griseosporeus TaxID=1910 RepID=UPI0037B55F70